MTIPELIAEMEAGLEGVTPGPWKWWTSNSWRRLRHDGRGITVSVIEPFVARDGHPDLDVSEEDMAHLARCSPDNIAAIIAGYREMDRQRKECASEAISATTRYQDAENELHNCKALLREALAALTLSMTVMEVALGSQDLSDEIRTAIKDRLATTRETAAHIKKGFPDGE